jgi:hypothetical protein
MCIVVVQAKARIHMYNAGRLHNVIKAIDNNKEQKEITARDIKF